MQSVIDFIQAYWTYISAGILILIEVLILILKKRPKTIDDFYLAIYGVLSDVADLVSKVECPGCGVDKKNEVIKMSLDSLSRLLGRTLSDIEVSIATSYISKQIEKVLSTPQKKGAQNA